MRQSWGVLRVRVLIAGGTGFLGRRIAEALAGKGVRLAVLSRDAEGARTAMAPIEVEGRTGDVTRPDSLEGAFEDMDVLVQCVQFSGYPVEDPSRGLTFMAVDAEGTRNVVRAAEAQGVRKLVYISGVGADSDSDRSWYRAKGVAEETVRASGMSWSIVRPSWLYGPRDDSLNRFIRILRTVPLAFPQVGPGSQRINPLHVADFASLVAAVVTGTEADGETVEAGGPEVLTMDEIVRTAMGTIGEAKAIVHVPIDLVKLLAAVLELLPGQILSRGAVDFLTQDGVADLTVLGRLYPGFAPRTLATGLAAYAGSTSAASPDVPTP